ncbi:MAG: hypothetical protein B0A82_26540 [Alkalinema sp. CACIAM 70d]|nr:MAG: hypothetical protein B0A82_26540 [Alkalinema sp. CACIAM 70d]
METQVNFSSYSNLFHGVARLGLLLGTLDLSWPCVIPYVAKFSEELNAYQELSLDGTGTTLGLMTHGTGKDFAFRVARYMETHSIDEDRLRRFLVRARFFEHCSLFFKVEITSEGPIEFSYYFRQRASLEVARAWLIDTGVDVESLALLDTCAQVLQKKTVHFLAAAECTNGDSVQKVYFSQPEDGKAWERAYQAGQYVGLTEDSWHPLKPHKAVLIHHPLFFSLAFANGQLLPGAKLDVQGVDPNTVEALMKETGQSQEACDRTRLLLELFEKGKFDYLGLRLRPNAALTTKVYAYRSSP